MMITPKVTLVGAGPGDPELISVKGVKALKTADVVLYDALVHSELLNYVPANAQKIFVGKKKGVCQLSQEEINRLIVDSALEFGHVVRLKGGDPFIFGRGHEEMLFAQFYNIPVDIIPGISSSIAVPELQRIPLTRRGINDSFWVLTGTTSEHKLSDDIKIAAQSNATVVILMGMSKLSEITQLFSSYGREKTPVAIIQNGSWENEKMVVGDIASIEKKAAEQNISSPAVIVIGEVVSLHPDYVLQKVNEIKNNNSSH